MFSTVLLIFSQSKFSEHSSNVQKINQSDCFNVFWYNQPAKIVTTFKINEIINKALRQFVWIVVKQIHFFFDKYIKERIQSLHFKKIFTIMLRKSKKKNYAKFSLYKSIALLNTLNKMLKLIMFERIQYVVKTLKTFSNI